MIIQMEATVSSCLQLRGAYCLSVVKKNREIILDDTDVGAAIISSQT